jgi:hypothetical protein
VPLDVVTNRMAEDPLHHGPMMPVQFNAFYHFTLLGHQSNPDPIAAGHCPFPAGAEAVGKAWCPRSQWTPGGTERPKWAGEAMSDIAASCVLLTCPEMPAPRLVQLLAQPARAYLARAFARRYRGPTFESRLAVMAEMKTLDPNMTATEVAACHRLAARARIKGAA